MTARYLPPGAADKLSKFQPWTRVLVETLPGVRIVAGGHSFTGEAIIDIPTDDVPRLQAKVRDESEWAVSERIAARNRENAIKAGKRGDIHTASKEHFDRHGKGGGSLRRVVVVEDSIPAPLTEEEHKLAQVMASVQAQMARVPAQVVPDVDDSDDEEATPRRRGRPRKSDD